MNDASPSIPESPSGLRFLPRLVLVLGTWVLIGLAQPGVVRPDGFGHLAFFAIGPWAYAASRPGRRAFLAEWIGHAFGLAGVFAWMLAFLPAILVPMAVIPALYPAFAGIVLRRAAGRLPLALLAPAAWMLAEVVRWTLPVPLSFGWFRLGMLMHDTEWLVGSAAFLGTWGLTWAMGALGGFAADVIGAVQKPEGEPLGLGPAALSGLLPLGALVGLDAAAGRGVEAQAFAEGPDVLVIQPAIEQGLKAARLDPFGDMYVPQVTATRLAIHETRREGEKGDAGSPDLVCWGETFLPGKFADEEVMAAHDAGARPTSYARDVDLDRRELELGDLWARELAAALFGRNTLHRTQRGVWRSTFGAPDGPEWADRVQMGEALLPPGTSFLTGVEAWTVREEDGTDVLKSLNAVALFSPDGSVSPLASKVHMVPGGESVEPLRGVPFVLAAIRSVAHNVPDFVGMERPGVLTLRTRSGAAYRLGIAVCYDNAFDDPFTEPLRADEAGADLFLVASNEAWYGTTPEMDHMLAFTRIAAAASQRSIVRATNSGISAVVGPDGEALAVLENEAGERKMVRGNLRARVPVPTVPSVTFFARTEPLQPALWAAWGALVLLLGGLARVRGRKTDFAR